jgi:hypothetical protein
MMPFSESITAKSRLARSMIRSAIPTNCEPLNELCIVNGFVSCRSFNSCVLVKYNDDASCSAFSTTNSFLFLLIVRFDNIIIGSPAVVSGPLVHDGVL